MSLVSYFEPDERTPKFREFDTRGYLATTLFVDNNLEDIVSKRRNALIALAQLNADRCTQVADMACFRSTKNALCSNVFE